MEDNDETYEPDIDERNDREVGLEDTRKEEHKREVGVMEKVCELIKKGYKRSALIEDFGYATATVDKVIRSLKDKGEYPTNGDGDGNGHDVMKIGSMKIGQRDLIPPESLLDILHIPVDGQATSVWKGGLLDGFRILLIGARYAQLCGAGQAETVENQLKIFKLAQEGSDQKLEQMRAEFSAAVIEDHERIINAINNQAVAQSPDPMAAMMQKTFADAFTPFLTDTLGRVMGGLGNIGKRSQPPGQQYTELPQGQTQPPSGSPQNSQEQQIEESPLIEHHSLDELE